VQFQRLGMRPLSKCRSYRSQAGARPARCCFAAFGPQKPSAAALLFLVQDRKVDHVLWRRQNTRCREQVRARDKEAPADADPLHLQVGVGVEALPNTDRDIDPFVDSTRRLVAMH
jgi:hypothetical protein